MSKGLDLILQYLKSARPIAEQNPALRKVVELIDAAIVEAEIKLKTARSSEGRKQ